MRQGQGGEAVHTRYRKVTAARALSHLQDDCHNRIGKPFGLERGQRGSKARHDQFDKAKAVAKKAKLLELRETDAAKREVNVAEREVKVTEREAEAKKSDKRATTSRRLWAVEGPTRLGGCGLFRFDAVAPICLVFAVLQFAIGFSTICPKVKGWSSFFSQAQSRAGFT